LRSQSLFPFFGRRKLIVFHPDIPYIPKDDR
jgi:hypothetical protein